MSVEPAASSETKLSFDEASPVNKAVTLLERTAAGREAVPDDLLGIMPVAFPLTLLAVVDAYVLPRACMHMSAPLQRRVAPDRRASLALMASADNIVDELKRRGESIARDLADAARRAGDVIDDGIDALLGPQPQAAPEMVPIPIPVDTRDGYGGYPLPPPRDPYSRY